MPQRLRSAERGKDWRSARQPRCAAVSFSGFHAIEPISISEEPADPHHANLPDCDGWPPLEYDRSNYRAGGDEAAGQTGHLVNLVLIVRIGSPLSPCDDPP